jgi:hypothetical protein
LACDAFAEKLGYSVKFLHRSLIPGDSLSLCCSRNALVLIAWPATAPGQHCFAACLAPNEPHAAAVASLHP